MNYSCFGHVLNGYIKLWTLRPSDAYMRQQSNHHCFRQWLVAWSAPSHYLNQCWIIVDWTLRNKVQGNLNRNSNNFIQENAFENVVCEMASICLGLNELMSTSSYGRYTYGLVAHKSTFFWPSVRMKMSSGPSAIIMPNLLRLVVFGITATTWFTEAEWLIYA